MYTSPVLSTEDFKGTMSWVLPTGGFPSASGVDARVTAMVTEGQDKEQTDLRGVSDGSTFTNIRQLI